MFMTPARSPTPPLAEAGSALIEVLISGVIAVLVAGAVMTLFAATERSAADQRHKTQAYAVAQEDQARLRTLRIPSLYKYSASNTVTVDGTPYKVESTGKFINNTTGDDLTCASGSSTVDFVKISSKVTWPGMGATQPTVIQSIVAPPNGSLNPSAGTVVFIATNASGTPISGIGLSATGAGTINGSTSAAGCAIFLEQAAGEYTLTLTGVGAGLVDQDGNLPAPKKIKVSPEVTNTVNLLYDRPGSVPIEFRTRKYSGAVEKSKIGTDSFLAYNTGMSAAKLIGTPEGSTFNEKTATSLFPFTSPDVFYAGACTTNDPGTEAAAKATVVVPAGSTATTQSIQLPALYLTVKKGGNAVSGAQVAITDTECETGGHDIRRTYTTNSSGQLEEPGLPWSTYTVCASMPIKVGSTTRNYRETVEGVEVHSVGGRNLTVEVSSEDPVGTC